MRPYGLRQTIRCPKKYGETAKKRNYMLFPKYNLDIGNESDPQRPIEDRYIKNAAILPDLHLPSSDNNISKEQSGSWSTMTEPLLIHGFTIPEYQNVYHCVVDPLLLSSSGTLTTYSLELGRTIKEHLFKELAYPTLHISEQPNGKMDMIEKFCILRPTPFYNYR